MSGRAFLVLAIGTIGIAGPQLSQADSLCFPAEQATQDQTAKPLTRALSQSFGNMHEVASESIFIKTALAGKLTKGQLLDHLEQRALVHEAIDGILGDAHLSPDLYGSHQRDVITLLRSDLESLGSHWPSKGAAWPLTEKFLQDIDASKEKGPYYALGVFHVYYGGITHGGRDIGAAIDHGLGTTLTYYQKSDGYEAYAKAVNSILARDAREEMVRGAVDAYHYIIAVNNLEVFKAQGSALVTGIWPPR